MRSGLHGAFALALFLACAPAQKASPSPPAAPSRCTSPTAVERIEVGIGKTVKAASGIGVTYVTQNHDRYEDGRTDWFHSLTFRGVGEDGEPTPSAFTWSPSVFAPPEWVYLQINRCARVVESRGDHLVIELAMPSP